MKSSDDENMPKLAAYKECTGCFACVNACPKNAIETFINKEGHYDIKVDVARCVHCGQCERICEKSRSNYGCNDLSLSNIYAGYTTDDQLRRNATSGGVFAILAKTFIEDGGVVVGASFDGTYARHIIIDKVEDIEKLQGSKYTPSSMEGVYKEIEKELQYKKVLFSGTGCQVAGVLAYFDGSKYSDNLYTVDLVCGGVPSTELIKKFNEHNKCKVKSFRNKDKYELIVENQDGKCKKVARKNLPLDGFIYGLTNRLSCYDCKFAFCHRNSDITIGDLWDYSIFPNEHENGISMVLTHNKRAEHILLNIQKINLMRIDWSVIKHNYRVAYGKEKIYRYRKTLAESLKTMRYNEFEKTYAMDIKPINMRLSLFKMYRNLVYRREQIIRNIFINSLIGSKDSKP